MGTYPPTCDRRGNPKRLHLDRGASDRKAHKEDIIFPLYDQVLCRLWQIGVDPLAVSNFAFRLRSVRPTNNEVIAFHPRGDTRSSPDLRKLVISLQRWVVIYGIQS